MDSLDVVELTMRAEEELGVILSERDLRQVRDGTAADFWRVVTAARTGHAPMPSTEPPPDDPLWHQLRGWLALYFDVPVATITPATRLPR